jgi:hypothetical protein
MDFGSIADDFFVNVDLQTALALPRSRETILHFFEAVQRKFPSMTSLYERESGEFVLESDRENGSYQWVEVQSRRLSAGSFNPRDLDAACALHRWLLEGSVYFLGVNSLDIEALDVLFGFNLHFRGNRDAIVADALLGGSALGAIAVDISDRAIECEPNLVVSLDEDCSLQARLSLETRSNNFQVRTGQYEDEPISVYFTVRQYPRPGAMLNLKDAFGQQRDLCEDLVCRAVIPNVVQPLATAIASAG